MKEKSGKRYFMVLAIVACIVVIIGATFAYFTNSAWGPRGGAIAESHFVRVSYNDGRELQAQDLIPATESVATRSYNGESKNGQCKDDNNRTVCSLYTFEVSNDGNIDQHIGAFISTNTNEFSNLRYALYRIIEESSDDSLEEPNVSKTLVSTGPLPTAVDDEGNNMMIDPVYIIGDNGQLEQVITAGEVNKYDLVIWLNEAGIDNDVEQGKHFLAQLTVSLTDQSHVHGYIENVDDSTYTG